MVFGDIFKCYYRQENEYPEGHFVFLLQVEDRLYTAKILSPTDKNRINALVRSLDLRGLPTEHLANYVNLTTTAFNNHAAHLYNSEKRQFLGEKEVVGNLNLRDFTALEDQIMTCRGYQELKDHIDSSEE